MWRCLINIANWVLSFWAASERRSKRLLVQPLSQCKLGSILSNFGLRVLFFQHFLLGKRNVLFFADFLAGRPKASLT